jgi:hypothetical protein
MASSTLGTIITKVRNLTLKVSEDDITDAAITEYVNTFIQYDFPALLKLFKNKQIFTFYLTPNVDTYDTTTTNPNDPLFNFKNVYDSVHDPVFLSGNRIRFTQSRSEFFTWYPYTNYIASVGTGDGFTSAFTGVLSNYPINQNQVMFNSNDVNGNALVMTDTPISPSIGNLSVPNNPPTSTSVTDPINNINYVTGEFIVTFPTAPADQANINSQTFPYNPGQPNTMLYYDYQFVFRPIPDQAYRVDLECFLRPSELLDADTDVPALEQWWQYIAYGAAKKILEDQGNYDTVQNIMPEFTRQEQMVLNSTIMQQSNVRTSTIFTQYLEMGGANYNGWFNNPF